jgi:hypothetical protein
MTNAHTLKAKLEKTGWAQMNGKTYSVCEALFGGEIYWTVLVGNVGYLYKNGSSVSALELDADDSVGYEMSFFPRLSRDEAVNACLEYVKQN